MIFVVALVVFVIIVVIEFVMVTPDTTPVTATSSSSVTATKSSAHIDDFEDFSNEIKKIIATSNCSKKEDYEYDYALPYVNCPNCGGVFSDDTKRNFRRNTCRCAYCDSVFSMIKY